MSDRGPVGRHGPGTRQTLRDHSHRTGSALSPESGGGYTPRFSLVVRKRKNFEGRNYYKTRPFVGLRRFACGPGLSSPTRASIRFLRRRIGHGCVRLTGGREGR